MFRGRFGDVSEMFRGHFGETRPPAACVVLVPPARYRSVRPPAHFRSVRSSRGSFGNVSGMFRGCLGDVSRTLQECLGNVSGNARGKTRQHKADGTERNKTGQNEHYQVRGRGASNMFPDTCIFATSMQCNALCSPIRPPPDFQLSLIHI